jgi:glycosyltransferase involved in cell wall biosynthesis
MSGPPSAPIVLTVAVCTWNRATRLRRLLTSLASATPPPVPWEVIVVDNNSTDATPAVAEEMRSRLPLRYVHEPVQGLSAARNRAIAEASGEILAFTDDDTTVDPGYLAAYAAAPGLDSGASFFGGAVEVRFEAPAPDWIRLAPMIHTFTYAEMRVDSNSTSIARDRLPYGCNFGFRRASAPSARFDPSLGVKGDQRIHGEETVFMESLLDAGGRGRWLPDAVVHHWIPPERTTWAYLWRYFVGMGRTRVLLRGTSQRFGAAGAAGAAASHLVRAGVFRAVRRRSWVGHVCLAAIAYGELAESLATRTSPDARAAHP